VVKSPVNYVLTVMQEVQDSNPRSRQSLLTLASIDNVRYDKQKIVGLHNVWVTNCLPIAAIALVKKGKIKVSSSSLQLIGQALISCLCSLEPAGPVQDGTLDTWLVHRSACSYLRNLLQQSPTVFYIALVLT